MRRVVFIIFFLINGLKFGHVLAQDKPYVVGQFKEGVTYSTFFQSIRLNDCMGDYSNSAYTQTTSFYIIGDTSCKLKVFTYYIVSTTEGIRFIEKTVFNNRPELDNAIQVLKSKFPDLKERARITELIVNKIESEESARWIKEEEARTKAISDSLKKLDKEIDDILQKWASRNWVLWDWDWNYSNEYSSFVDIDIEVINPFKKKIKYISFTFYAKNPVGDPISGPTKTVRGIGPIEYSSHANYKFESVYYSKVVSTITLTQINIQFFDGTIKIINKPRIISPS